MVIDAKTKDVLNQAFKAASEPPVVQSAFELTAKQRTAIQNGFDKVFSTKVVARFEAKPDLVSGIELTVGGQKIAWSISDHMSLMEADVSKLLSDKVPTKTKAAATR